MSEEKEHVEQVSATSTKPAQNPVFCSCVQYLREELGVPIRGNAIDIEPNVVFTEIEAGDVALFAYGNTTEEHHAALIIEKGENGIVVQEANWDKCEEGTRFIPYSEFSTVRGFYRAE